MKHLLNFMVVLSTIILTACNNTNIEGSWVELIPGMPDIKQGFTLRANGNASSINMKSLLYEKWEHKNKGSIRRNGLLYSFEIRPTIITEHIDLCITLKGSKYEIFRCLADNRYEQ